MIMILIIIMIMKKYYEGINDQCVKMILSRKCINDENNDWRNEGKWLMVW